MVEMSSKHKHRRRRGRKDQGEKHKVEGTPASSSQPHGSLLIQLTEDAPTWYQCCSQQADRNATIVTDPPPQGQSNTTAMIEKYRTLGDEIYAREVQLLARKAGGSSDDRWIESTIHKGTLKDRIAAMSVIVSTDPVHKFYALDGLLRMVGCSESSGHHQETNSRVAQLAAGALEDLFLNTFLPPERKLLTLAQRPLYLYEQSDSQQSTTRGGEKSKKKKTKKSLSPRILLLWRFEEMVQSKYQMFIQQYLGSTLQEGVELQKIPAIRSAATFLRSVPEGEQSLLQLLVNKLGDPAKKVAAAAGHELRRVLQQHPVMQQVVAREVQQLAHRPHLSARALYNCIIFLNQLRLSHDDELPASLICTYFRLFEVAIGNSNKNSNKRNKEVQQGIKSRLLSALLSGVNRAHPFLPALDKDMEQHIDALYRLVHTAPPAACTQALLLLFHLSIGSKLDNPSEGRASTADVLSEEEQARQNRFYRALYSTLSETALLHSGKHLTMFFNLLYKSIKYDTDANRVGAFCKRIAATTLHASSSAVSAASLFLINEICKTHPTLLASFREVPVGEDALCYLDATKRDPRGALVVSTDSMTSPPSNQNKLRRAPGWELTLQLNHFHPTVRKFASCMGDDIMYSGDPLKDFALAPFLDKFAYRNPKSRVVANNYQQRGSIAKRRSADNNSSALPVNDPSFLEKPNVGPEDEFFHRFFVERARRDDVKGIHRYKEQKDNTDQEDAEVEALDAAEEKEFDNDFSRYEQQWDADSEEEAFVDSLAQKMMEDSADVHGPADLDDEDPDTGDWGNLHEDDDDDKKEEEEGYEEGNDAAKEGDAGDLVEEPDDDAFMDDSDDDEDKGGDVEPHLAMDGELGAESESSIVDFFAQSSEDDDDGLGKISETFAPAEDYEKAVNNSWNELKRARPRTLEKENDKSDEDESQRQKTTKKRKKKRRHR